MVPHEARATTVYTRGLCELRPAGQIWLALPVLYSLKLRIVFTFFKNDFYIFKRLFKKNRQKLQNTYWIPSDKVCQPLVCRNKGLCLVLTLPTKTKCKKENA